MSSARAVEPPPAGNVRWSSFPRRKTPVTRSTPNCPPASRCSNSPPTPRIPSRSAGPSMASRSSRRADGRVFWPLARGRLEHRRRAARHGRGGRAPGGGRVTGAARVPMPRPRESRRRWISRRRQAPGTSRWPGSVGSGVPLISGGCSRRVTEIATLANSISNRMHFPLPTDEAGRLRALSSYALLDTPAEPGVRPDHRPGR